MTSYPVMTASGDIVQIVEKRIEQADAPLDSLVLTAEDGTEYVPAPGNSLIVVEREAAEADENAEPLGGTPAE